MLQKYGRYALLIVILAGALYALYASPAAAPEPAAPTPEANQATEAGAVTYYQAPYEGYLALPPEPDGKRRFPAVILIHEWWGLNDDIRALADAYAQEGYVALAVDLYGAPPTTDPAEAGERAGAVRADLAPAFANLEAAVAYLRNLPEVDPEKLASVGWCFGGGWSYQMAVNDLGTRAAVMYYGQFDPEDDFAHMRASILGHFGEADRSIAIDDVYEFQAALETASGTHAVYIYPNAGHGFANERAGANAGFDPEAAAIAWDRTQAFLREELDLE